MTDFKNVTETIENMVDSKIEKALRGGSKSMPAEYMGTDSEGKMWVMLPSADSATPVRRSSVECNVGDIVNVTVGDGMAVIDANLSDKSAGMAGVEKVDEKATVAKDTAVKAIDYATQASAAASNAQSSADSAMRSAGIAQISADSAVADAARANEAATQAISDAADAADAADSAQSSANSARTSADKANYALADMEKVVGTVNWIAEHGEYELTSDTAVDDSKVYYTRSGSGTQADPYTYSVVANPVDSELSTYYELHIDESVQNYIAAHLWLDDYGLNLSVDSANGYRIHQGTVDGTRAAGTYILDPNGYIAAKFGPDGAQIGPDNSYRTRFDEYGIEVVGAQSLFEVSSAVKQGVENWEFVSDQIHYAYKGDFDDPLDLMHDFGCYGRYAMFELPSGIKIYDEMRFVWYDAQEEISQSFGDEIYVKTSPYLWFTDETPVGPDCDWMPWSGFSDTVTGIMIADDTTDGFYEQAFPLDDPWLVFNGIQHTWSYVNVSKPHMRFGTGTLSSSDDQAVLGRWNVEDTDDEYAVIVGNGTAYSHRSNAFTLDWDGNVICNEVNGLALQSMGEIREASGSKSVETSTNRNVATIRLPPGTWLVNARLQYSSNATGRRGVKLSMTSEDVGNPISADVRNAVNGAVTHVQTERVFAITDSDVEGEDDGKAPVYLIAWQNSGSTLSCAGNMQAVRLSPAIGESYDGGGGGGGGTSDYADLANKPAINGVTLSGDKSSAQLGLQYTGDESLPNEVSGAPNPSKNIIVDNDEMTIQANLLTAAQAAALFT